MLEQIKKVVANGNQSGVVNSKIAVFKVYKTKNVVENLAFSVNTEDMAAVYNILPLYWLIEHPKKGLYRVGNYLETKIYPWKAVVVEGTKEEPTDTEYPYLYKYLVIANWPDNVASPESTERVI